MRPECREGVRRKLTLSALGRGRKPAPDAVFGALADPTRRALLSQVAAHPATATELAGGLPISRQAVVKHLGTLADAGLLERQRAGRDVLYRTSLQAPLSDAVSWIADVGAQWDERLASLARMLQGAGPNRVS